MATMRPSLEADDHDRESRRRRRKDRDHGRGAGRVRWLHAADLELGDQRDLPAMHQKLDYDPIKSFLPIAKESSAPYLLIVNADVPVKNARELADYVKANPKLAFAAPTGTPPHILAFVFKELTGADFTVALYKGGGRR